MFRFLFVMLAIVVFAMPIRAQDPPAGDGPGQAAAEGGEEPQKPAFVLDKDVEAALTPLFKTIALADKSRCTVELSAETLDKGKVVNRQKSTYQIASTHPNKFTVYYKQPDQRVRVYCDGKDFVCALAPDAFFRLPEPMNLIDAVFDMPVPMGHYPEPVYALTFAGADPSLTLLAGMESLKIVERGSFRGKIPSIQLEGVQDDGVKWNFWISREKEPKPLRLQVDLTVMLRESAQMQMPKGLTYELRFDFLTWRMSGDVDPKLFAYNAPKNAIEFESMDDYYLKATGSAGNHPLHGREAPEFSAESLNGKKYTPANTKGKVKVLNFWATWAKPCAETMPVTEQVCAEYAKKGVVLLPVNVGEKADVIKQYLKDQGWKTDVIVDEKMAISKAFKADVIPLTMLVGKNGMIESVHFGFAGEKEMAQRLRDELDVLCAGGLIATAKTEESDADENANQKTTDAKKVGKDAPATK